ncbi:MAG: TIGR04283 family arsenosugar biosynthesis glycosyltransferase [Gammaproteobacteria bacterium]|nr:TIGR04283 family arsenosugar biosynthesis glycosyltransferase [Gammaproteobacteria bacterium]
MSTARLSVIIPALDDAEHLAATLDSVAALRRSGHEVIVVDGGSRDATRAVARAGADRVLASPCGRARQMNAGAAAASGDALVFLHADTLLPEHAADTVLDALERRCWGRFDVRLDARAPVFRIIESLMNLRSRMTGIATGDQCIFVERTAFRAVGGYPEIPLMEDVDLSRRLNTLGPPACVSARVVTSARRWRRHGILRTVFLMWRLRMQYALGADPRRLASFYERG